MSRRFPRSVTLGLVQFERRLGDKPHNTARGLELIGEAADRGAQYVALPELFNTGYFPAGDRVDESYFDLAEAIPGPTTAALGVECERRRIWVIAPLFERDHQSGLFFNSAAVIGPGGVVGKYRKRHISSESTLLERYYFKQGDIPYPVFDCDGVRIGVSICYDRHFPETFRHLALRGAEIVFSVSNTSAKSPRSRRLWEPEVRVNSSSNGIFIAQVNAVSEALNFFGCSLICSPEGEVIASLNEEEGLLVVTLNLAEVAIARRHYGSIADAIWSDFGVDGKVREEPTVG